MWRVYLVALDIKSFKQIVATTRKWRPSAIMGFNCNLICATDQTYFQFQLFLPDSFLSLFFKTISKPLFQKSLVPGSKYFGIQLELDFVLVLRVLGICVRLLGTCVEIFSLGIDIKIFGIIRVRNSYNYSQYKKAISK